MFEMLTPLGCVRPIGIVVAWHMKSGWAIASTPVLAGSLGRVLSRSRTVKATYHMTRRAAFAALATLHPELLSRIRYRLAWRRWPDLANPTTFDEKLLWLNLHWRHPLKTECGDKYGLRAYVERQGLRRLLPQLYGVYDSVDEIDFAGLPERFVLKCTHGCKCNVFCRNRADLDVAETRLKLARWMATDYSRIFGELHYATMKRRIICEEFLDDGMGTLPADYKFYCFNGKPSWILVCANRPDNGMAHLAFRDTNWNRVTYYRNEAPGALNVPCPPCLPEMLAACERLSAPFPFVRVDFYSINDRPVLGEMTFTPDACIDGTYTDRAQREMGHRLTLPPPWQGCGAP